MNWSKTILSILMSFGGVLGGRVIAAPRPDLVARVAAGELKEARASWWGFDTEDSTRFLQQAIDSKVPRLIIDRQPTPWFVLPLKGVSNQELFFEPGTVVQAKRGAYQGRNDCLLSFSDCTNVRLIGPNATLRMWHEDYMKPPYEKSEWRHALSLRSVRKALIEGLTIEDSGGDGIYVSRLNGKLNRCLDVVIRGVTCRRNHRQGISVISAENLLIENCKLIDTVGRPPESGIDFEPNQPHQRLVNVVMRNCEMTGNRGDGITISLQHFFRRTAPISLTIENCVTRDNEYAFRCSQNSRRGDFLQGFIKVRNCTFAESRLSGLHFLQKTGEAFPVTFENCRVENSCRQVPDSADVTFDSRLRTDAPPDGIRFDGLEIVAPVVREPFAFTHAGWCDEPVKAITGRVTLKNPEGTKTLELDEAFRNRLSPVRVGPVHAELRLDAAKVVDGKPDELLKLSRFPLRGSANYIFYADRAKTVRFVAESRILKPRKAPLGKTVVRALEGGWRTELKTPVKAAELSVEVPSAGFYALEVALGAQVFQLKAASVPVALWLKGDDSQGIINSCGRLYIRSETPFAFHASGEGFAERIAVEVFDPSGASVWTVPAALRWKTFRTAEVKDGLWTVRLSRPKLGSLEDYHIDLTGTSPVLFLSKRRWW